MPDASIGEAFNNVVAAASKCDAVTYQPVRPRTFFKGLLHDGLTTYEK